MGNAHMRKSPQTREIPTEPPAPNTDKNNFEMKVASWNLQEFSQP